VSDNKLQKKLPDALKEKTQYFLTFGVIATMLLVVGFPTFVIAFFGIFAYFLFKTFIQTTPNSTREVFEFYLSANEILRSEDRRWFGFEIQEIILNGEIILQRMSGAPPLVYFALGSLYNKIGNHKAAVNHLSYILENETTNESNYLYATPELKEYVKILRKIEREPTEAPQTSAAIRSLERARRNKGKQILEESRQALEEINLKELETAKEKPQLKQNTVKSLFAGSQVNEKETQIVYPIEVTSSKEELNNFPTITYIDESNGNSVSENKQKADKKDNETSQNRKPITEVLHDIYGK
jgi:hypothetical protein